MSLGTARILRLLQSICLENDDGLKTLDRDSLLLIHRLLAALKGEVEGALRELPNGEVPDTSVSSLSALGAKIDSSSGRTGFGQI
jgi:hypothetical protein